MATPNQGRQGRPWRRAAARVRARREPCWICGQQIDYDLPAAHRMAFTVDHVLPYSMHPDQALNPQNLKAAHRACNSARGTRHVTAARGSTVRNSRTW